jgi:hypothetical protein
MFTAFSTSAVPLFLALPLGVRGLFAWFPGSSLVTPLVPKRYLAPKLQLGPPLPELGGIKLPTFVAVEGISSPPPLREGLGEGGNRTRSWKRTE